MQRTLSILTMFSTVAAGQIPLPTDAPKPRTPEESAAAFVLPDGFEMQVIASEPLIASPSGVCWDARGRMFVSELHGYNLEGQLDIEELNKSGQLDTQVRRVQADEKFKLAAKAGTYGVVKVLRDTDGDGCMDEAVVWANDLPPAYGLVPARDGVIVACAPDIVLLADRDGDGRPEVRETLFTGFKTGALERGINAPQWNSDGWIYFGRGWGGGEINGPHLAAPVTLPDTDFRLREDGSAIEPVPGGTHTFGFAMTRSGDRFLVSTTKPAICIAPLPWRYLARNPDVPTPSLEIPTGDRRVHPLAPTHPWRQKRADDPAYFKYYRDRYGAAESEAEGWFTAACGPMIYRDAALPGLHGQYFVCEPAGSLIHRAIIEPEGAALRVHRAPEEKRTEFAASRDPWSHPIALTHGPDGAIWVVDYYREIIEDYSAIPRHLQQQYGVYAGHDRGRIYRLTHRDLPPVPSPDLSALETPALAREIASPLLWRRQTTQRLLTERNEKEAAPVLREILSAKDAAPEAIIAALGTLVDLGELHPPDVIPLVSHPEADVRVRALRVADQLFQEENGAAMLDAVLSAAAKEKEARVQIQFALSLGETNDPRAFAMLARYAREHLEVQWMDTALLSSLHGRATQMISELSRTPRAAEPFLAALAAAAKGESTLPVATSDPSKNAPDAASMTPPPIEVSDETFRKYVAALVPKRNLEHGHEVFRQSCAVCHRLGEEGSDFGPDLLGELGVAEETLVRHLLLPNERIRPEFETTIVEVNAGTPVVGLLKADGATSVTLRLPGGLDHTLLRKDIKAVRRLPGSLMPSFATTLAPADMADLLAWLRSQLQTPTTPPP